MGTIWKGDYHSLPGGPQRLMTVSHAKYTHAALPEVSFFYNLHLKSRSPSSKSGSDTDAASQAQFLKYSSLNTVALDLNTCEPKGASYFPIMLRKDSGGIGAKELH